MNKNVIKKYIQVPHTKRKTKKKYDKNLADESIKTVLTFFEDPMHGKAHKITL